MQKKNTIISHVGYTDKKTDAAPGPKLTTIWEVYCSNRVVDLVAVNRLIEDAKANVIEFKPKELLSQGSSIR